MNQSNKDQYGYYLICKDDKHYRCHDKYGEWVICSLAHGETVESLSATKRSN